MSKKLLVDASRLKVGGGVQVGISFLIDMLSLTHDFTIKVLASPLFHAKMIDLQLDKTYDIHEIGDESLTKLLLKKSTGDRLIKTFKPSVVFTVFGPCIYRRSSKKIVGFAIPHLIYPDSPFFSTLNIKQKIRLRVRLFLQKQLFKHNSDALIFETQDAATKFCELHDYSKNVHVVNNTLNAVFLNESLQRDYTFKHSPRFRILVVTSNYPHKNNSIIPHVVDELIAMGFTQFSFAITLREEELKLKDHQQPYVEFLGRVNLNELPSIYYQSHCFYLPTLLEVFSVSHLEAMYCNLPIITSDYSFVRDVCGDAAIYVDAQDAKMSASMIKRIMGNNDVRCNLIDRSRERITHFYGSSTRTKKYLEILNSYD